MISHEGARGLVRSYKDHPESFRQQARGHSDGCPPKEFPLMWGVQARALRGTENIQDDTGGAATRARSGICSHNPVNI